MHFPRPWPPPLSMFVVDFAWSPFFECWRAYSRPRKRPCSNKAERGDLQVEVFLRDAYSARFHT
jgi:hypothetical protein